MGWPQWVVAGLLFLNVGFALARWGDPKVGKYGWLSFGDAAILFGLLWAGGFWS